jgi:hypothetical protein
MCGVAWRVRQASKQPLTLSCSGMVQKSMFRNTISNANNFFSTIGKARISLPEATKLQVCKRF